MLCTLLLQIKKNQTFEYFSMLKIRDLVFPILFKVANSAKFEFAEDNFPTSLTVPPVQSFNYMSLNEKLW